MKNIEKELEGPLSQHLDLFNFPRNHRLYSNKWKGKLGKLKVETQSDIMTEFVGVRPKCYSYLTKTSRSNAIKGVPYDVQRLISHQKFVDCVMKNERVYRKVYSIRNCRGEMSTTVTNKLALSSFEDKRYYLSQTASIAYGHPLCRNVDSTVGVEVEGEGEETLLSLPSTSTGSSCILRNLSQNVGKKSSKRYCKKHLKRLEACTSNTNIKDNNCNNSKKRKRIDETLCNRR